MEEIQKQREKNKAYQKVYNKVNSDKNKEYQKEYYKNNKQALLDKANEKVICEYCNRKVSKCRLIKHHKTTLCMNTQARNIEHKTRKELK